MADTWEGVKSAFGGFGDRLKGAAKYGPAGLLMDKQQQDILGSYYDEYLAPVLRPAERITEAPGVLRDITAGVVSDVAQPPARMPGDTDQNYGGALDYFKLARQGVGDYGQDQGVMADIAGALGLGPETTQRGGVGEDIINATFGKYEKPPEGEPRPWTDYLEVPARVGGAFALEQITDPGNILGMGVAAKGIKTAKTLGKGMAAQEAIAAGAGTDTLMDVMRGVADVAPGLEKSLAEYQQYRKVAEPLNALGDINDAVQAARETERSYQETGLSPETLGAATLAAITGLDVAGSAHNVVETTQNIYDKITDPAGMPRAETKQEQMLVDGFKALIQEGILSPEDAAQAHAAFKGHNFAEEVPVEDTAEQDQMVELTPQPMMAAQPITPYAERKFPVHQAVKVTLEDGTIFYDFIDGLNQGHAMQRARVNWDGATVEPVTVTEANKGIELDNLKHEVLMKDLAEPDRRLVVEDPDEENLFTKRAAPFDPNADDGRAMPPDVEGMDKFYNLAQKALAVKMNRRRYELMLENTDTPEAEWQPYMDAYDELAQTKRATPRRIGVERQEPGTTRMADAAIDNPPLKPIGFGEGLGEKFVTGPRETVPVGASRELASVIHQQNWRRKQQQARAEFNARHEDAILKDIPFKATLPDGTVEYGYAKTMAKAKERWPGANIELSNKNELAKYTDEQPSEALSTIAARKLVRMNRAAPKQPVDRKAQQVQAERAKLKARKDLLEQKAIEATLAITPVEREFIAAEIELNNATQQYNRMRRAALTPEDIDKADAYYRTDVMPRTAKYDTSRKKYTEVKKKATSLEKHAEAADYELMRLEKLEPLTQQEREPIYRSMKKDEALRKAQIDLKEAIDAWNAGDADVMAKLANETIDLNIPDGPQVLHDITKNNSQWQDVQRLVQQMAEKRLAKTPADAPIKALEQGKEPQAVFPNRFNKRPGSIAEKFPLGKPWRDLVHPGALKGLEKHGIKISPEAGWVGGGAFNAAFYVGDDAKGNQYILRKQILGRKEDITSGDKARWKTMIPQNNPAVVPYYGTYFADEKDERGEDVVVGYDLTKRIKTPVQLGFTGEQTEAAGDLLDAYLKKNNIIANDLHRFNIGFVEDPRGMFEGSDGKRYRPQAFDLGTSNYAQAVNRAAPSEVMALVSESKITPEAAVNTAEQILSDADKDSQSVKVNGKDSSPEWEAFERRINAGREKSKKAGIEPVWKIRTDLMKKGFTNLVGKTLGNEDIKKELALALRVTRQPFEVGQVVAIKHINGKATIVYHRAFTSAKAKMFNAGDPAYKAALREADDHVEAGKADFFFSTHNHAGDDATPSQPDVDSVAESTQELGPGYLGEIIIDYNTWAHIPSDKSYRAKGDNWEPVPASNFKYKKLGLLEGDDPIIPSGGTDVYSIDTIKGLNKSFWDPKSIARFAKGTVASDSIAAVGISGDGIVHQILKIPMDTFRDTPTRELHDMLEFEASQAGVMNWAIVSELDPQSNDHARVWHKAESLRLQESVGGSINFWNGSSRFTDFNLANEKRFVRKGETQRVAAMGKTPEERMKALEQANDFVLRKLLEFNDSRANRPDIKEDAVEEGLLQGELAQTEVGPPDITLKPGQGGPGPINVKYNLQGMKDSQLRREIGDMLAQKGLDRQAPGPTSAEIEEGYQELLSHMSADDAHSAAEFISTKDGQVAAFERFNYYRDALRLRDAAWADFQQTKDGGDKATQDAARVDLVKAETLLQAARKDFANLKTTVGRMLNFLKELKDAETDPELNRVGALMSALRRRGVSKDQITALMKLYNDNPSEFGKAVEKAMEPTWLKAFLQFWKAGLVSGPPTRLANIGSNTLFRGIVDMTNNIFTPALDIVRTKALGGQQERFFGETAASLLAYQQQFPMAMRQWIKDKGGFTFQDITTLEGGNADIKGEGALQQKLGKLAGAKGKAFADISDMAFKGLNVDDTFAKHMAAAQAAYRYAYREARKGGKSHHEAMETFADTAQEILAGLKDPESPEYKKHASVIKDVILKRAKAETFQEDMKELAKSGETFLRKHPSLQLIIPFYVTPVNILKKTLEYTPAYLLRKGGLRDLFAKYEAGKIGGDEAEELAKAMMGVYIAGAVATIAAFGGVTGGGPGDPKKQEELKKTGWQPYSFKVGDTYYSYQRLEPIAGVVGIAADMAEAAEAGAFGKDALTSDKGQAAMVALVASIFDNMTSKTFLAGLEGLFTAYHDPKRYLSRYVRQMEASLVPNIIGRTAQAIDPNFRDTSQGWLDPAKAKIPFLSKTLPAQTTASGQERLRPGSAVSRFLNPLVASKEVTGGAANLSKELVRINYLPTIPKTFQTIGGKKVVLTTQEITWLKEAKAKAQKDAIRTVRDPSYLRLPDNEQDPKYRLGMATKRDVLEKIYRRHRKVVQDRINMRVRERAMRAS